MKRVSELSAASALVIWIGAVLGSGAISSGTLAAEMEEVVVQARLQNSAEALVSERMNDDVATDLLGAEMISRVGDSNVAAALRRIAGLTLVDDKFIYVRGLGERYSSSTLNRASIPSPDLTRNVIPLDIFPTSIVESLAVQKGYSPDKSASFGGGNVDIRTKAIPDRFTYSIEVGGGLNTQSDGGVMTYNGGSDDDLGTDDGTRALPSAIVDGIGRFLGSLDRQVILNTLRQEGDTTATPADAAAINRDLALNLNRDLSVGSASGDPDWSIKGNVGTNFYIDDNWEAGFLLAGGYSTNWRKSDSLSKDFTQPEERQQRESRSVRSVDINANLNLGVRFTDEHQIATTTLYIRNSDDEVSMVDRFNENFLKSDGRGLRDTVLRFQERDLIVNQAKGEHYLGQKTRSYIPWVPLSLIPEDFRISWQYSKANATTSIPNEVAIRSGTLTDPVTAEVLSSAVQLNQGAEYRFTDLNDEVIDYSGQFTLPILTSMSSIEISGGLSHSQKQRLYRETRLSLVPNTIADATLLSEPFTIVFSDESITDPANDYSLTLNPGAARSYIAATVVDAAFGKVDWTWNDTWRVAAGARWESYRQLALPFNIYGYTVGSPQVSMDSVELEQAVLKDDTYYPVIAITYMTEWWAEVFQLRVGLSETVVRPDLREITDASYLDARTNFLTAGCPTCVPADVTNLDLRAEWFFSSGDNLTATFFVKDLTNPIEFFEVPASDTNRSREIVNAESGKVKGIEIEGLKSLAFMGGLFETLFIQGNFTIQDSELVVGSRANVPTNPVRPLAGASEYVVNLLVGFDSMDGSHSATLVYNVFGERLFTAGRNGAPDSYEQPFNSVDLTYSWYPTESLTLKAKLSNLLNETVTIESLGIETYKEKPGMSFALSLQWTL
ncbi:MAG: TonB-dependent receptor [Pseudomonadales bacterium]